MVDDESPPRPAPRRGGRHLRVPGPRASLIALAVLIVAMALVLILLPSSPSPPTVTDALDLAGQPAIRLPPAPGAERALGWEATGSRTDQIGDRQARTAVYERNGRLAVLTVVDGDPLESPGGTTVERAGIVYTRVPGGLTWVRDGHTRVLSGAGVPPQDLLALAAAL